MKTHSILVFAFRFPTPFAIGVALILDDELRVPAEREFVDDGYSGATLARPGLDRLRQLVTDGGIDRLYVLSLDRLARTRAHQALLLSEFEAAGIRVVSIDRVRSEPAARRPPHA